MCNKKLNFNYIYILIAFHMYSLRNIMTYQNNLCKRLNYNIITQSNEIQLNNNTGEV